MVSKSQSLWLVPFGALLLSIPSVSSVTTAPVLRRATVASLDGFSGSSDTSGSSLQPSQQACFEKAIASAAVAYQYDSGSHLCKYGAKLVLSDILKAPTPGVQTGFIAKDCDSVVSASGNAQMRAIASAHCTDTVTVARIQGKLSGASYDDVFASDSTACERRCISAADCVASRYTPGTLLNLTGCRLYTGSGSVTSSTNSLSILGGCNVARAALPGFPTTCTDISRVLSCPTGKIKNSDSSECINDCGGLLVGSPDDDPKSANYKKCECTPLVARPNSDSSKCYFLEVCSGGRFQDLQAGSPFEGQCICPSGTIFDKSIGRCVQTPCPTGSTRDTRILSPTYNQCVCDTGYVSASDGTTSGCLKLPTCPPGLSVDLALLVGPLSLSVSLDVSACTKCTNPLQLLNSDKSACVDAKPCPLNAILNLVTGSSGYGTCRCNSGFIFNNVGKICLPIADCSLPNQIQDLDVTTAVSSCICKAGSVPSTVSDLGCIVDALCDTNTAQQDLTVAVPTCLCKAVGSVLATDGKSCLKLGPSQVVGGARKKKRNLSDEAALCPPGLEACSIGSHDGYECVDLSEELERCGHCNNNCLDIEGVDGVSCSAGSCQIFSCAPGYKLAFDSNVCRPRLAKRH